MKWMLLLLAFSTYDKISSTSSIHWNTDKLCSCSPLKTQEEEFKRSKIAIQGRIIASEEIIAASGFWYNRRGIRYKDTRVELDSSNYIKHTLIVERNFKPLEKIADTIFLITRKFTECGPYIELYSEFMQHELPQVFNLFIYADNFIEYKEVEQVIGKRKVKSILKIVHEDVFFTERCRRIQRVNEKELKLLEAVSGQIEMEINSIGTK